MSSIEADSKFQIPHLDEDNYFAWSVRVKSALIHKGCWEAIEPGYPAEAVLTDAQKAMNSKALAFLLLVVSDYHLNDIGECLRAREAWETLEELHSSYGLLHQIMLFRELLNTTKTDDLSAQEYIGRIQNNYRKVSKLGLDLPDQTLAMIILMGLPSERYEGFVRSLERDEERISTKLVKAKLLLEEKRLKRDEENTEAKAMVACKKNQNNGKKFYKPKKKQEKISDNEEDQVSYPVREPTPIKCYCCGKFGHISRDCPEIKEYLAQKSKAETTHGTANSAVSQMDGSLDKAKAYCSVGTKNILKKRQWYLDSGSSDHMSPLRSDFVELSDEVGGVITMGNGEESRIKGKGKVVVKTPKEDGGLTVTLSNALYVPELECGLMSVAKLTDKGLNVNFSGNKAVVTDNGELIFSAQKKDQVYIINAKNEEAIESKIAKMKNTVRTSIACKAISTQLWHQRFGHLHEDALKKIPALNQAKKTESLALCDTCIQGKFAKFSFPKAKEEKSRETLEIIHSDLMGKIKPPSVGGSSFVMTMIDDKTRFTTISCLKRKSEAFDTFKNFQLLVENQKNKKIRALQSDNGGEYESGEFQKHLEEHGISPRRSIPGCPQQNGVAERMNRTLTEMARCLMIESGAPGNFWAEALMTACFIRNMCPSSSIKYKIPYEEWYDKKLTEEDFNRLKVFGCKAWSKKLLPTGKFSSKAEKCVMVGYDLSTKDGYRLWSLERKCFCIRRDVIFEEDVFPFKEVTEQNIGKTPDPFLNLWELIEAEREKFEGADKQKPEAEKTIDSRGEENDQTNPTEEDGENSTEGVDDEGAIPNLLRRSTRERKNKEPCYLPCCKLMQSNEEVEIPVTYKEAINGPQAEEWEESINVELQSLQDQQSWEVVRKPTNTRVIGCKWVFSLKTNELNTIVRYKARLVAQGYRQRYGVDYFDVSSPVMEKKTVRLLAFIAVENSWELHHIDVVSAYLNSVLDEEIYMTPPEGSNIDSSMFVCLLKKSVNGLKQSGKNWYVHVKEILLSLGFERCVSEPCVFMKKNIIVGLYVDDFLAAGEKNEIVKFKHDIEGMMKVKDLGPVTSFLSIHFSRPDANTICLNQQKYVKSILDEFSMSNCKGCPYPLKADKSEEKDDLDCDTLNSEEKDEAFDKEIYQRAIGRLLYLSTCTRPDVANAVCKLSQSCTMPTVKNWTGVKNVLRYLKQTIGYQLVFKKGKPFSCFSDADWAGDLSDGKSITGYALTLGGGSISWRSRKQRTVSSSSTQAEYIAVYECACELIWLKSFLSEIKHLHFLPEDCIIFCDNQSAITIAETDTVNDRSKHFVVKYKFVRELVNKKEFTLIYIPSTENPADVFTKSLSGTKIAKFSESLGLTTY